MPIKIISSITQTKFLPLLGILLILVIIDITTRLTHYETKQSSLWELASANKQKIITLTPAHANSILAEINNYQISSATIQTHENITMSEAEQLAQQGSLSQLYAGNIRYRLIGIFDKNEKFVAIQQLDVTTNKEELVRVSGLERLGNYQITEIFPDKVILQSDDNRQIILFLYKKITANNSIESEI